jgi:hypothetical protein
MFCLQLFCAQQQMLASQLKFRITASHKTRRSGNDNGCTGVRFRPEADIYFLVNTSEKKGAAMTRLLCFLALLFAAMVADAQDCGTALSSELLKRAAADQAARKVLLQDMKSTTANNAVLRVDADNTSFMRGVLSRCGWPKKSVVGPEAAKAAWLLTQHADMDPEYQVLASRQLKYAVLANEAEPWDLAVLVDRNRRLNDQPQVYGMQYYIGSDGVLEFYDIVNPAQLDRRRKEIGLPPFFCWAESQSKDNQGAAIRWPVGVLVKPVDCSAK